MSDELARLRAEWDQNSAGLREVASSLGVMYRQLQEEGFSEERAFGLIEVFLTEQLRAVTTSSTAEATIDALRRLMGGEEGES